MAIPVTFKPALESVRSAESDWDRPIGDPDPGGHSPEPKRDGERGTELSRRTNLRSPSARAVTVCLLASLILGATVQAAEYYTKHDKNDQRRGEPDEGHALVYVFRPATVGGAIKTWAFADDELMMVSKPRAYSFALVPAGKRLFWTKSENTSALEMEVEAGETYYLKVAIRGGVVKARAKILQVDEVEAQKYFQKCSYVESTEAGLARAVEIVANRKHRAVKKVPKQ